MQIDKQEARREIRMQASGGAQGTPNCLGPIFFSTLSERGDDVRS